MVRETCHFVFVTTRESKTGILGAVKGIAKSPRPQIRPSIWLTINTALGLRIINLVIDMLPSWVRPMFGPHATTELDWVC